MTSLPKVALSMLISVVIFAGSLFFSFAGGFKVIEVQYYAPKVIGNINGRLEKIKESYGEYFSSMDEQFRKFLSERGVASYIEREPSRENMDERDRISGILFQKNPGLDGIRLIENDGIRIHFSTFAEDVLKESDSLITYSNYSERIPFAFIETSDGEKNAKVYFDNSKNRLIFSYPFYDVYTACRGTMAFYVSGDDFTRFLIARDVVSLNARGTVLSPAGFAFNIPLAGRNMLINEIQGRWEKRNANIEQLVESDIKKENLFVVSTTNENGVKIGWLCTQEEFEFSDAEKFSLMVCVFITLFLIVFLLFNVRHDDMVIIRRRIRKFQYGLLKEYIERKDSRNWKSLSKEIASRRMDVNDEVKKSLGRRGKKHSAEIDEMLESSWKDMMTAFGATTSRTLSDSNSESKDEVPVAEIISTVPEKEKKMPEKIPEAEDAEELEAAEEVQELEEIPEAEDAEELETAEEVQELEKIPEAKVAEELEAAEEVQELEEIPEAEDAVELSEFLSENDKKNESDVIFEQSFADYKKKEHFPAEREIPADADEIRQKSRESFSVSDINFSNLDGDT